MVEKLTVDECRKLIDFINKGYKVPQLILDVMYRVADKEIVDRKKVVILKRDPNVGRDRIQAMLVTLIHGNSIEIYPSAVTGFGADFDGDSFLGSITLHITYDKNVNIKSINIKDVEHEEYIEYKDEKTKDTGVHVINYTVNPEYEVSIKSINIDTGLVSMKPVIEFSIHENIEMYKIEDKLNRFDTFWASYDHSMVVYDSKEDNIKKISPKVIKLEPERYFLLKHKIGATNE